MFLSNRGSFRPETSGAYTLRRRGRRRPKSGSAIGACAVARLAGSGGPIGDYYGSANRPLEIYVAGTGCDAVEDRVRHQLALDAQVPLVRLELRGDDGRAAALARLHDLEQVDRVLRRYRRRHEVVDQQERDGLVGVHLLEVAAVLGGAGPVQIVADVGEARVAHGYQPAARRVAESLNDEALAAAGFRDDHDDLALADPLASGEAVDTVLGERPVGQIDDVLDACRGILEARVLDELGHLALPPGGGLRVDEHLHLLLEGEPIVRLVLHHLAQLVPHGLYPELSEQLEVLFGKHPTRRLSCRRPRRAGGPPIWRGPPARRSLRPRRGAPWLAPRRRTT